MAARQYSKWLTKKEAGYTIDYSRFNLPEAGSLESLHQKYRYSEDDLLGRGAFSRVYEGHRLSDKKLVVVKITKITEQNYHDTDYMLNEIKIFFRIHGDDLKGGHENIQKFMGWYISPNEIILIFEYCDEALFDRFYFCENPRVLTEDQVKPIIFQLTSAIQFIHERNIVHRDIKLANILCEAADSYIPIRLADFNLAFYVEQRDRPTPINSPLGSVCTMDPQQLLCFLEIENDPNNVFLNPHLSYTRKCDIFAIGAVMYELLTFQMEPFKQMSTCNEPSCPNPPHPHRLAGASVSCTKCSELYEYNKLHLEIDVIEDKVISHCSEWCKDFLYNVMTRHSNDRMTISGCLNHPWLYTERQMNK